MPAPSDPNDRAAYERERWEREQFEEWRRNQQSPPVYEYAQRREDGGRVVERRVENGNGSGGLNGLADMAMGFVESQGGRDGKGGKGGKGDLVGKLLGK